MQPPATNATQGPLLRRLATSGLIAIPLVAAGVFLGRATVTPAPPGEASPPAAEVLVDRFAEGRAARSDLESAVADLAGEEPRVRSRAIQALSRSDRPEAARAQLGAVYDANATISFQAADGLRAHLRAGRVTPAELARLARDVTLPRKTHVALIGAVSHVASPEATELLLELMERGTEEERRVAAGMLLHQGLEVAVPALIAGLSDPHEWVRYNCAEALGHASGGLGYGQDAAAWSRWWAEAREARR